jgi:hypothetical protein
MIAGPVYLNVPSTTPQNISATGAGPAVSCRGAYDKTFGLVGTFGASTQVQIQASIALNQPGGADPSWATLGTLSQASPILFHSGIVRWLRYNVTAVTAGDNFSVVAMWDDRG